MDVTDQEILTVPETQAFSLLHICDHIGGYVTDHEKSHAMAALAELGLAWGQAGIGYRLTPRGRGLHPITPRAPIAG